MAWWMAIAVHRGRVRAERHLRDVGVAVLERAGEVVVHLAVRDAQRLLRRHGRDPRRRVLGRPARSARWTRAPRPRAALGRARQIERLDHEAARLVRALAAVVRGVGEHEPVARAGHADVEEPALLAVVLVARIVRRAPPGAARAGSGSGLARVAGSAGSGPRPGAPGRPPGTRAPWRCGRSAGAPRPPRSRSRPRPGRRPVSMSRSRCPMNCATRSCLSSGPTAGDDREEPVEVQHALGGLGAVVGGEPAEQAALGARTRRAPPRSAGAARSAASRRCRSAKRRMASRVRLGERRVAGGGFDGEREQAAVAAPGRGSEARQVHRVGPEQRDRPAPGTRPRRRPGRRACAAR